MRLRNRVSSLSRQVQRSLHSLPSVSPFQHRDPTDEEIYRLSKFITETSSMMCITGAGVSTLSGLPDYRGENGSYKLGHKPMVHQEFIATESSRQRYWTRSMAGYERVALSKPNDTHTSLAKLEDNKMLGSIITQNVDRLHQKAGSIHVTDLHGRIDENICLQCKTVSSRDTFQLRLRETNPDFVSHMAEKSMNTRLIRADGDVDLGAYDYSTFKIPCCEVCGGVIKPNVVFFGDTVPVSKVEDAYSQIEKKCDGLLVIGTSLEVFSAYRFVMRAEKLGIPMAIVNHGETRAERQKLVNIKFKSDANCGVLLRQVVEQLSG